MPDTTDIEKKSLEAHVELCAERYRTLELKLETVRDQLGDLEGMIRSVHDMLNQVTEKRNTQIVSWGIGIIGTLAAMVAWFAAKYLGSL